MHLHDDSVDHVIRPLSGHDDLDALTALLHRAYAGLADMGLRFLATHQDTATTRARIRGNETFVAERDSAVVGTITLVRPGEGKWLELYQRPGVASFTQFAVEPALQGAGIGHALLTTAERRATELGAEKMALDTAEAAVHLVAYYERRGYRIVGHTEWDVTNYRSVIMCMDLSEANLNQPAGPPPRGPGPDAGP